MLIYKDIFSNAELLSDSHKLELINEVVFKVRGKLMDKDCNIDDSKIGGNKSAEACEDEQAQETKEQVIDLVDAHQLQKWCHDKKGYKGYIRDYMKRLTEKLKENGMPEEELKSVQKNLQVFVKGVIEDFKSYEIYIGEDMDGEAMNVLCKWEEDETVPYFYFFKHGLLEEKV